MAYKPRDLNKWANKERKNTHRPSVKGEIKQVSVTWKSASKRDTVGIGDWRRGYLPERALMCVLWSVK